MSIHTTKSYEVAKRKGAFSALTFARWEALMSMSKRELAEIAIQLAAMCADNDDPGNALWGAGGQTAMERLIDERDALKANGLI